MSKSQQIKVALAILGMLLAFHLSFYFNTKVEDKTPIEWVHEKHAQDSVYFTENASEYAHTYLDKILYKSGKKISAYNIYSYRYDSDRKAYMLKYFFIPRFSNKEHYKKIWIRMEFKSNGGDYEITPRIIRIESMT